MELSLKDGKAVLKNIECFSPRDIFDNGQCFRFYKVGEQQYEGVAHGRFLRVAKTDETVALFPVSHKDYEAVWKHYFDLETDYTALFCDCQDKALARGKEFGRGLRVLNQEPFETLISFIVSANNNVARIRGIIARLCELCGKPFEFEGKTYYAFPEPQALASLPEEALRKCGCGYRAPYIHQAAGMVAQGFGLEEIRMLPYAEAKKRLRLLPGVGPKVADCVLLFSLGFRDAFPADVWIKRVMAQHYGFRGNDKQIYEYAREKFGEYSGIAQQYLFFMQREAARPQNKDKTENGLR